MIQRGGGIRALAARRIRPVGILAGSTVTCVTGGIVNADIGISPGSALVGFGPCVFTGTAHLADAPAATAQNDLTTAYNTLAGLPCGTTIVANLGGTTLLPGVYCSASSIGVTGPLTLNGNGNPNATLCLPGRQHAHHSRKHRHDQWCADSPVVPKHLL